MSTQNDRTPIGVRAGFALLAALAAALIGLSAHAADPHHDHSQHGPPESTATAGTEAKAHDHSEHGSHHGEGGHGDHQAGHAPIGVMGDHVHAKGEWMVSYRYMHMAMNDNYEGTDKVSVDDIRLPDGPYMVAPEDMTMDMHMFGIMYAPLDRLTLMAMIPFITKSMDHVTAADTRFTTDTKGVGDLKLSLLYQLWNTEHQGVHLQLGFSSPTGSIDETDTTPAGPDTQLPYPMQIGSGTFDLIVGSTYTGHRGPWSWGGQATGVIRLGENDRDYRLGHQYQVTGWGTWAFTKPVSASFRLAWNQNFNIEGADPALNPMMIPTADPNLRAGKRLDALFGLDFTPSALGDRFEVLEGLRIALEGGLPAYQSLDGPQLGQSWQLTTGVQYAF